ncbi:uncharacterized protein LOC128233838 isoform X2 [Mya arenaria]|uniref:uncharacterized protein LOC128233838 isoform X2 n=1 Tax=Mya arenaria TaxID=6604 RepID=UPI0022E91493|nr:uncharacterized protein LOC128233838 isoform X2 [Mya arenaria]
MDMFVFILIICVVLIFCQDSGLQIEFQRVLDAGTQSITQIHVDSSRTDTFQVMCKVNNVNQLDTIIDLIVQYKPSANSDYTDLAVMQNFKGTDTDTYQKPVLASGSLGWEAVGSFDTINSNGRDTTLGVSRPVSTVTCSNAVEYRCQLTYTKPGPSYRPGTGEISKELDVQVLPTTISRQVYNISGLGSSLPITPFDTIEPFYVGQAVKMECSANIGSYNGTAQIRWLKSNIVPGSPLAPYFSPDTVLGDPQSTGNCVYQQTDSVTYNMTAQDALRTAENRLHFQCFVYIPGSMTWETPEDDRGNFKFIVYSVDVTSVDNSGAVNSGAGSAGIVAGVVAGALAAIVIIVLLVYFLWYRRRSSGDDCNAKNAAIQLNVNPVFETPISPSNEHLTNQEQTEYTEIGIPADGQSGAARYKEENSSYEHLGSRERSAYTELGNSSRESPSQYVNQHTDSNATGSSYEVPDNQEPSKESRDYENEKDQYEHTPASTYDHVYTAPLEHQYSALDATK